MLLILKNNIGTRCLPTFLDEYKAGRTPNPDVMCNKEIKFKAFLRTCHESWGRLSSNRSLCTELNYRDGEYKMLRGVDENKDQTYFLNQLTQEQLV